MCENGNGRLDHECNRSPSSVCNWIDCGRWCVWTTSTATAAESAPSDPVRIDGIKTIELAEPTRPPKWALLQRRLLRQLYPAAREFVGKYTRPDGTLIWRDRWPGMDGSDDGYESFYNFPLYYALGGPEEIHGLSRKLWTR